MNAVQRFCLVACVAIATFCSVKGVEYKTDCNVPYYEATASPDAYQQERCRVDVYYPADVKEFPTIVWFHGGGLTAGEKSIPDQLKNRGYAVVAVNYRLSPKVKVEDCVKDAAAAVAWTFRHIEQYGGSSDKIAVAGHSAGAYLTAMVGLDKQWLKHYDLDANRIVALFPFSGNALCHMVYREERGIRRNQPYVDAFAPMYHARPDAPPTIFITGDRNMEMFGRYEEVAFFWRIMKENGHTKSYLYELQGYDHGGMAVPGFPIMLRHLKGVLEAGKP